MSRLSAKRAGLTEYRNASCLLPQSAASILICVAILLAFAAGNPERTAAHGGGVVRLSAAPAGPYVLTVWVSPEAIRAGRPLHVTVSVEKDDRPELDAEVLVQVVPEGSTVATLTTAATSDQSVNKLLYEADLTIPTPGSYSVEILVTGPAGQGQGSFTVDVNSASNVNWFLIGAPVLVAVATFILIRRRRRGTVAQIKP